MKKISPEDHDVFYLELHQTDYFEDIEIQDEHDNSDYDQIQGLSDQQVSELARDSIRAAHEQINASANAPDQDLADDDTIQG